MGSINKLKAQLLKSFTTALLIVVTPENVTAQNNSEEIVLTEEEQAWIVEHPTITAGSNTTYAPFDFISAGEPVGISIDYLNILTSKVGLKVEYVNYGNWVENLKMGMEQKIDVLPALIKNEIRQEHFNFSTPYIVDDLGLWGRTGSNTINNIMDLKDKRIGIIKGNSISISYQQHYPNLNYLEFKNNMEILRALSSNEVDVYPNQIRPVEFSIAQNNLQGIEIIGDEFVIEERELYHRLAVHKNNPILMSILNKSMAMVSKEEFEAISDKWIKPDQVNHDLRLTLEEQNWLAKNKIIKVSAQKNAFPFEFIDKDGEISGISGNFLSELAKRLNVKFVWVGNEDWNEGLLRIHSRDADMVSGITPTKARQSFLEFSDIYLSLQNVIISRDDGLVFANMDTLDGRTVVQTKSSAIIGYLNEKYPNIKIVETKTRKEALEILSSGEADVMIDDVTGALANISNFGFDNLRIVGTTPYSEVMAMGVSSELPLLSSAIQKALANIDPEIRSAIFIRWLTQRVEPKVNYGPLWNVLIVVSFIVLFILVWNRKLIIARKEAEEANGAKSNFLSSMSHDLRTPLNAIIGFSEAISRETFGPVNNKKYAEYIADIHSSGKYLLHLVNDILDLSALEADKRELHYESFCGEQLVLECKNIVSKLAADKNIDIVINNSKNLPNVYADRNALKQVLMNIISNAIKFTPPNGNITIHTNASDDNYIFQIVDTGYGILKEDIRIITKPFSKARPSVFISHEEGVGLGLSIVKSLIDIHRGELDIESIIGEGTTITVSIPLQNAVK